MAHSLSAEPVSSFVLPFEGQRPRFHHEELLLTPGHFISNLESGQNHVLTCEVKSACVVSIASFLSFTFVWENYGTPKAIASVLGVNVVQLFSNVEVGPIDQVTEFKSHRSCGHFPMVVERDAQRNDDQTRVLGKLNASDGLYGQVYPRSVLNLRNSIGLHSDINSVSGESQRVPNKENASEAQGYRYESRYGYSDGPNSHLPLGIKIGIVLFLASGGLFSIGYALLFDHFIRPQAAMIYIIFGFTAYLLAVLLAFIPVI